MIKDGIQKHMLATYANLRIGVAAIAIAFPLLLWVGGAIQGLPLQDSMSAYYHAIIMDKSMRNWFVGILFAVGVILYLYKGYSDRENYALNFAGAFAIGIAIFPMEWNCGDECKKITIHGICAVLFFLLIAYVCIRCAPDTLPLIRDEARERRFLRSYRLIGIALILSPLTALLLTLIFRQFESFTFFAEAAGIWAFASYWLLKSWEISSTNSEQRALSEKMET